MRFTARLLIPVLLCATALAGNAAWADDDAPCDPEKNPLNAPEQAFYGHFTTLRDALPKPTAGFQLDDASQKLFSADYAYMPASECGLSYYSLSVSANYLRGPLTAPKPQAVDPDKQKKIDELQAQEEDLAQKMLRANDKNDFELIGQIGAQKQKLDQQLDALQGISADGSASRAVGGRVILVLNDAQEESCYGNPHVVQVSGATAYRCVSGSLADKAGVHILVMFGKASTKTNDDFVTLLPSLDNARATQVQEVTVVVDSDDAALADALYNQIDMDALRNLIEQ
jgi:hypothetical protein